MHSRRRTDVSRRLLGLLAAVVVLSALTPGPALGNSQFGPPSSGRDSSEHDGTHLIVRFRDTASREDRGRAHDEGGGREVRWFDAPRAVLVRLAQGRSVSEALARYRTSRWVAFAEPNYIRSIDAVPDDPRFGDLWGLRNTGQSGGTAGIDIDAPRAWDIAGFSGSPWPAGDVTVGVIDTGVQTSHPDLAGKLVTQCSRATSGNGTLTSGCADDNGHGTHIAGTIGAAGNNATGIVGADPGARLAICKALDASGRGTVADFIACLDDLRSKRASLNLRVVNASFGATTFSQAERDAVDAIVGDGVLFVAAAGNSGNTAINFPAGHDSAVAVGAVDRGGQRASFSVFNSTVELAAPGVEILSTWTGGGYRSLSGTSQAAPHVAGAAALVSAVDGKTGSDLRTALQTSAVDLGAAGRDNQFGFGLVNPCRALGGCTTPGTTPGPSPAPGGSPTPGQAPVFTSDSPCGRAARTPSIGGFTSVTVRASAPENATVTLNAEGLPSWSRFSAQPGNPATGTLSSDPRILDFILSFLTGDPTARIRATTGSASATCDIELFVSLL